MRAHPKMHDDACWHRLTLRTDEGHGRRRRTGESGRMRRDMIGRRRWREGSSKWREEGRGEVVVCDDCSGHGGRIRSDG